MTFLWDLFVCGLRMSFVCSVFEGLPQHGGGKGSHLSHLRLLEAFLPYVFLPRKLQVNPGLAQLVEKERGSWGTEPCLVLRQRFYSAARNTQL